MTAAQFVITRVQLLGLPQTMTSGANPTTPPAFAINRVSRNLFGSTHPDETRQLYQEEMRQNRERFMQRYNFDIMSNNSDHNSSTVNDDSNKSSPNENLIAKELLQHELRLAAKNSKENTNGENRLSSSVATPLLPINGKLKQIMNPKKVIDTVKSNGMHGSCNGGGGGDRLKPYARQSLLTDCYNLRKSTQCSSNNNNNNNSNSNSDLTSNNLTIIRSSTIKHNNITNRITISSHSPSSQRNINELLSSASKSVVKTTSVALIEKTTATASTEEQASSEKDDTTEETSSSSLSSSLDETPPSFSSTSDIICSSSCSSSDSLFTTNLSPPHPVAASSPPPSMASAPAQAPAPLTTTNERMNV